MRAYTGTWYHHLLPRNVSACRFDSIIMRFLLRGIRVIWPLINAGYIAIYYLLRITMHAITPLHASVYINY